MYSSDALFLVWMYSSGHRQVRLSTSRFFFFGGGRKGEGRRGSPSVGRNTYLLPGPRFFCCCFLMERIVARMFHRRQSCGTSDPTKHMVEHGHVIVLAAFSLLARSRFQSEHKLCICLCVGRGWYVVMEGGGGG